MICFLQYEKMLKKDASKIWAGSHLSSISWASSSLHPLDWIKMMEYVSVVHTSPYM